MVITEEELGFVQRGRGLERKILCMHLSTKTTLIFLLRPLLSTLPGILLLNLSRDLLGLKTHPWVSLG